MFDLSKLQTINAADTAGKSIGGAAGQFTVINSKKNGKRVTISQAALIAAGVDIKIDKFLALAFYENSLLISKNHGTIYTFRVSGAKAIIYNFELVREVTDYFKLDFSECVSKTATNFEIIEPGIVRAWF